MEAVLTTLDVVDTLSLVVGRDNHFLHAVASKAQDSIVQSLGEESTTSSAFQAP